IILYQFWHDPKSRLQQCCLSIRDVDEAKPSLPIYKLIEEKGPPNHKQYRVAVYFNRRRIGEGTGKSIHDAEIEAAKHALKTKKDMFPILDKYIAAEIKKSKYIVDFENDEAAGAHKKSKRKSGKSKKAKTSEAN
ncbi:ribonuclease 3, partial [Brachionus plicatilis]